MNARAFLSQPRNSRRAKSGFSLLEMMVALAIFVLLCGGLFALMSSVLQGASILQDGSDQGDEVSALNTYMKTQLGTMTAHSTPLFLHPRRRRGVEPKRNRLRHLGGGDRVRLEGAVERPLHAAGRDLRGRSLRLDHAGRAQCPAATRLHRRPVGEMDQPRHRPQDHRLEVPGPEHHPMAGAVDRIGQSQHGRILHAGRRQRPAHDDGLLDPATDTDQALHRGGIGPRRWGGGGEQAPTPAHECRQSGGSDPARRSR